MGVGTLGVRDCEVPGVKVEIQCPLSLSLTIEISTSVLWGPFPFLDRRPSLVLTSQLLPLLRPGLHMSFPLLHAPGNATRHGRYRGVVCCSVSPRTPDPLRSGQADRNCSPPNTHLRTLGVGWGHVAPKVKTLGVSYPVESPGGVSTRSRVPGRGYCPRSLSRSRSARLGSPSRPPDHTGGRAVRGVDRPHRRAGSSRSPWSLPKSPV